MKRILVLLVLVAVLLCGCGNLGDLMMSDWEMPELPTVPDLEDLEIEMPEIPTLPEFSMPEIPTLPEIPTIYGAGLFHPGLYRTGAYTACLRNRYGARSVLPGV